MDDSILTSIKKALSITEEYTVFDEEIIMFINSALSNLLQLGIGPVEGVTIEDKSTTWSDLLGESKRIQNAKSYVYIKTKMAFDPPTTPHLINAYEEQLAEQEFRLSIDAQPPVLQLIIVDGGGPDMEGIT